MYSEQEARELVIKAGMMLVERGLVSRTWGNVSARISDKEFIITPSGKAYEDLSENDLVKVAISDCSYEGEIKPSSEKKIHAAAYSLRSNANFIIHTHQHYACVVGADELDMPFAPCAEYGLPGTDGLKKNVVKCINENSSCKKFLLAKHGTLLLGESMDEAFRLSSELEEECKEQLYKRIPSMDPYNLDTRDVSFLENENVLFAKLIQDVFIAECCSAGIKVKPYLDDYAQMIGPDMSVVKNEEKDIKAGLFGRNAVLVKGVGAICIGETEDDVDAVATIVKKNCCAACYVRKSKPLSHADSLLQRYVYLNKYSKLKKEEN